MAAMSIGDAARAIGVPAWKLRAWEAKGYLSPRRAANDYRVFDDADLVAARELHDLDSQGNRLSAFAEHAVYTPRAGSRSLAGAGERPKRGHPTPMDTEGAVTDPRTGGSRTVAWGHLMHALRSADNQQQAYEACLDAVLIASAASIGEIVIADTSRHQFVPLVSRGLDETYRRATRSWQLHEGLAGRAYSLREPVVARDLQRHTGAARVPTWRQELRGYMCVPMLLGSRRVGVIEVFSMAPREFVGDEIDAVEELATLIATVVDARRTTEQLEMLRAQRSSFARRWTAQWSIATQVERERIAKSLDVAIDTIERGDLAAAQVAALVRDVARGVRAADRAVVDGEALLRSQIRSSVTEAQWRTMRIEFDAWPELLPLEFATRHALAIGQLIGRARQRIGVPITVQARSEGSELLIELVTPSTSETTLEEIIDAEVTARALLDELGAVYALLIRDGARIIRIGVVPPSATPVMKELSPRERNVLAELGTASSNAQLAADLGISVKTLQNHVTAIYRKLGVAGRVEALAMLNESGVE